ncbi:hypothetical protein AOLI_G00155140 [Acnodon oligacanthus]
MKPLITLLFIYMLWSEDFQASTALNCYNCIALSNCTISCAGNQTQCYSVSGTSKGCIDKRSCNATMTCCSTDLCNSAEGVKLSLLFMVLLISSTPFI